MKGNCPPPTRIKQNFWIKRVEVEELRKLFNLKEIQSYFLIHGENGVGKSSLVREAAQLIDEKEGTQISQTPGVVYVNFEDEMTINQSFAKALQYQSISGFFSFLFFFFFFFSFLFFFQIQFDSIQGLYL